MKQIAQIGSRFFRVALPLLVFTGSNQVAMGAVLDDPGAKAQADLDDWNAKGAAACEANEPACLRLAESLYNAAIGFQAAGEREKAISARQTLLNPRYHLQKTDIAKKTMFQLAEDYKSLTEYARAAEQYESAVQQSPNAAEAPEALVDATVMRLASGDVSGAIKNAENYDKLFGAKKPAAAASVWLAIALTHLEREKIAESKALLEKIMGQIERVGELRDRFLAHAGLGRVLNTLGDNAAAEREYGIVRSLWQDEEIIKRVLREGETNPRNVGKVLTAVGEALFFFAEQKRKAADAIRFPVYAGAADIYAVRKHVSTKVGDWTKKKREVLEAAEMSYRLILDLQPAPPPKWVVAAANRIGTMWASHVAEFRAAPIPKEWTKIGLVPGGDDWTYEEVRHQYYAMLDEASEPQKQHAKAAFKKCVDFSVKFQYVDDFSHGCGKWLEKHYRKEHIPVTEIIPAIRTQSSSFGWAMVLPEPAVKP